MRASRKIAASALAGTLLATAFGVAGASAVDTDVSFVISEDASGLTIDTASAASSLAAGGFSLTGATVTGSMPVTTVTDERGGLAKRWTVSVASTDFVNDANSSVVVTKGNAHAYLDAADATAFMSSLTTGALSGMVIDGGEFNVGENDLSTSYTLITGTTTLGNGSVNYTPTVDVTVPAETPAGTYTAKVTQTVS